LLFVFLVHHGVQILTNKSLLLLTGEAANTENFKFLYDLELPIRAKVEAISKEIYGAEGVDFTELAEKQMAQYELSGFGNLPSESSKTL